MTEKLKDEARDGAVDEAMEAQAKERHQRYSEEFVEAFGLCPWAKKARRDGKVATRVLIGDSMEETLTHFRELGEDLQIEVAFLVYPQLSDDRRDDRRAFEHWVSDVRRRNAAEFGASPPLACAAFHPNAKADTGSPARLIPFIRRSPDPTIQLVRRSVLDAIRGSEERGTAFVDPSTTDLLALLRETEASRKKLLHERVAEANFETLRNQILRAEAVLLSIQEDKPVKFFEAMSEQE